MQGARVWVADGRVGFANAATPDEDFMAATFRGLVRSKRAVAAAGDRIRAARPVLRRSLDAVLERASRGKGSTC